MFPILHTETKFCCSYLIMVFCYLLMVFCYLFSFIQRLLSWVFQREYVFNNDSSNNSGTPFHTSTAIVPLRNRTHFHRLPPEIRMLIWTLCVQYESSSDCNSQLQGSNFRPRWGVMYAFSSERVLMNEILSSFYRSTAFELTEIFGIRIARREPSKHLRINLAVVMPFSRIVPVYKKDSRYPPNRRSDVFEVFFAELRRHLAMAAAERQYLWNEVRNEIDINNTICTMSLRFERTLDSLDFYLLHRLTETFENLEEIDITYILGTLRYPSFYHKDPIDPLTWIDFASPTINDTLETKWILVQSEVLPHTLQSHRFLWRINRHWNKKDRMSQESNRRSSLSSDLHPLDHLGWLARLADLSTA